MIRFLEIDRAECRKCREDLEEESADPDWACEQCPKGWNPDQFTPEFTAWIMEMIALYRRLRIGFPPDWDALSLEEIDALAVIHEFHEARVGGAATLVGALIGRPSDGRSRQ